MKKGVLTAFIALSLVSFLGCSQISDIVRPVSTANPKILRKAALSSKWQMVQISLDLEAGIELPILMKLADSDKVDGYFYLEKGNNVDFKVTANSVIYQPNVQDASAPRRITSDRFSFIASQAQGSTYSLTFRNTPYGNEKQTKVTVFVEVIYPVTSSMFTPIESK